ncbi:MAG TPA: M23 family metallopeptidase [Acidimicrobiales bacterium]|nr:M23 family metallopeptidase [Acidimicrobiales bacterium]
MAVRRRPHALLALAVGLVVFVVAAPAQAQLFPWGPTTTTTAPPPPTAPPPEETTTTTTTTAPPPPAAPNPLVPTPPPSEEPSEPAPAPAPTQDQPPAEGADQAPPPDGGDGGTATSAPRGIPPEAQAVIDSIRRSPANSSKALHDAVQQLVALGLSEQEAIRVGFGRFPVAGVATFVHDWYFPRWGPGFRFHMGTDVFAAHGTPLRSPVDGTVTAGNGGLGGLYVKVFQPDGSYFYMAHLSALPDGFENGMAVRTGDIVGYVGDSGNARGGKPHLHLGIYTASGEATDPKPVLDQMLADAMAALPGVVEQVRAQRPVDAPSTPPAPRVPRSLLATSLLRPLVDGRSVAGLDAAVLFEAVGNPSSGGLAVAEAAASQLAGSIDWEARAARDQAQRQLIQRAGELFRLSLGPLAR